jgi:hypothetical protein
LKYQQSRKGKKVLKAHLVSGLFFRGVFEGGSGGGAGHGLSVDIFLGIFPMASEQLLAQVFLNLNLYSNREEKKIQCIIENSQNNKIIPQETNFTA